MTVAIGIMLIVAGSYEHSKESGVCLIAAGIMFCIQGC